MRAIRYGFRLIVVVNLVLVASCRNDSTNPSAEPITDAAEALEEAGAGIEETAEVIAPAVLHLTPAEWQLLQTRIIAAVDTVDLRLREVRGLSLREKQRLRQDVNAIQITYARYYGIRPTSDINPLIQSGQLVQLAGANRYWVVRKLDYSVPYVTPSTEAMLVEVAKRFQAKLDQLNVPRYRLDITSVLRTSQSQAKLRRLNGNASRRESAHEFGTTVDIAYRRFAPPPPDPKRDGYLMNKQALRMRDSLMVKLSNTRSGELEAVLGRVLREMQQEGKLLVRLERRQTVYHITVARPYAPIRWRPARQSRAVPVSRAAD